MYSAIRYNIVAYIAYKTVLCGVNMSKYISILPKVHSIIQYILIQYILD